MNEKGNQRINAKYNPDGVRTDRVKPAEKAKMVKLKQQGKTIEEIAAVLERNRRTVWNHLQREKARAAFAEQLGREEQIITSLVMKAREQHLDQIRSLIERWKETIRTPDIGTSPFEFLPVDHIKKDPLFNCLPDHVRYPLLWQDYNSWKSKLSRYLPRGQDLRSTIRKEAEGWQGVKSILPDFAVPILFHINLKARKVKEISHGFSKYVWHEKQDSPSAMETLTVDDYPVLTARDALSYISQYQALSTQILSSENVEALIASFNELKTLEEKIHSSLEMTLLRRDYTMYTCELCRGQLMKST